jgi:HK97 family phage major capsid protein
MSGINTNRSNIALPTEVSAEIMQKAQENSAVMQLAKKIPLPGRGLTIPVITGDPEAAWVGETNKKPVSNPGITQKIMQGYTMAVIVPFSNQFKRDAKALYDALLERLPLALGQKFDHTVYGGVEAPGSNFDTFAEVTAQSVDSSVYDALVAADTDIAVHGGILNGYALSPQAKGVLLGAKDTTNRPLFINSAAEGAVPMLLGAKVIYSKASYIAGTSGTGSVAPVGGATPDVLGVAGDWTQALYGIVEDVKVSLSDQATLTIDNELVSLFERNMFAVRAEMEVGFRADTSVFNRLTRTHSA